MPPIRSGRCQVRFPTRTRTSRFTPAWSPTPASCGDGNGRFPSWAWCIETRAAGVVETDAARAAATLGYQSGRQSLPQVLAAVEEQTSQTLAFLQTLTDYNQALAQYTVAVLPPSTPSDTLAAALLPPQG